MISSPFFANKGCFTDELISTESIGDLISIFIYINVFLNIV